MTAKEILYSSNKHLGLLLVTLLIAARTYGGVEHYSSLRLEGTQVVANATITAVDAEYTTMANQPTWGNLFYNKRVTNRVTFGYTNPNNVYYPADFNASVEVAITYYQWSGSAFVPQTVNKTLTVNYKTAGSYDDKSVYEFAGGNKLSVKVLSITTNNSNVNFTLESEIEIERYRAFDAKASTSVSHHSHQMVERGELEIYWDVITGAEEYDLEWAYVNNYDALNSNLPASGISIDSRIFQFNSTRITTTENNYKMPYLYGRGYILYRVRGKGKTSLNSYTDLIDGRWSSFPDNHTTVAAFPNKFPDQSLSGTLNPAELFFAHEDNFNWQFSASYAEEGKSKAVISYFDGSLRNRQSVTKLKTIDQVVVGESIYDHQGRPGIQVLPVPVNSYKIDYQKNFNQNPAQTPYSRLNFDLDMDSSVCPPRLPDPMFPENSGASNYYSTFNPDKEAHQAYVPDAEQYPFTQVEYTPDNTGRIRAQSGVGPTFQLSNGHETKYFYGSPEQEELDRLFGSEVGVAAHYKKNMVRDANGQMSVSYLDPQGRVIATGLTGLSPLNLMHLDSVPWSTLNVDLLNKPDATAKTGAANVLDLKKRSLSLNRSLLIGANQQRDFNYDMIGNKYEACGDTTSNICYDCVLDLKLSLTDECNTEHLLEGGTGGPSYVIGQAILDSIRNGSAGYLPPNNCNSDTLTDSHSFPQVTLNVGNYQLTKTLSVNDEALKYYTNLHIKNDSSCVVGLQTFLDTALAHIDMSGCNMSCDSCVSKLGSYTRYNDTLTPNCDPCLTRPQYDDLLARCQESCNSKSYRCDALRHTMLKDMSAYGQYGTVRPGGGVTGGIINDNLVPEPATNDFNPGDYPLSVFNENNRLPQKVSHFQEYTNTSSIKVAGFWHPNWRYPYNPEVSEKFTYLNENGGIAMIRVEETSPGSGIYEPAILGSNYIETLPDGSGIGVRPQFLASVNDFIALWEPQWANALLAYHPEYGYYVYCGTLTASNDFDDLWTELATINDVNNEYGAGNFLNPVTSGIDPYFQNSGNPNYNADERRAMLYAMNHFADGYTIWEMAYTIVNCPNAGNSMSCATCTYNPSNGLTTDAEWNVFKGLYRSLKQKFMDRSSTIYAIENGYYNGCIAEESFQMDKDNFFHYPYFRPTAVAHLNFLRGVSPFFVLSPSQMFNSQQPCNWLDFGLYADKQQRSPTVKDMLQMPSMEENICFANDSLVPPDSGDDYLKSYDVVDCTAKAQKIIEESGNITQMAMYDQCGKCPNAQYLETFLNSLSMKDTLTSNNLALSCFGNGGSSVPEFTEQLASATGLTSISNVVWNSSTSGNTFTGYFQNSAVSGDSCKVELKFPASNTLYDFSDIVTICCVKDISNPTLFSYVANKNFSFKAVVNVKPGDPLYHILRPDKTREIDMEGLSCIKVGDCQFDPICHVSKEASQFQNTLNGLVYKNALTSSNVPLTDSVMIAFFSGLKDKVDMLVDPSVTNSSAAWEWDAVSLGTVMSGSVTATGQSGNVNFVLNFPASNPNGYTFADVKRFSNVNAFDDGVYGNFTITALVQKGTAAPEYMKLIGVSSALNMGTCTTTLPSLYVMGGQGTNSNDGDDLLKNGNFELGNDHFFHDDYNYITPGTKFNSGNYTIVTDASLANSCCWKGKDHTTGSTNLMAVSGIGNSTSVVWRYASLRVTPGKAYRFSVWVSTLDASCEFPAVISFKINGVETGGNFTAPLTTNNWIQHVVVWTAGSADSLVNLQILSKNTHTASSNFGLDDIVFAPAQSSSSAICEIASPPPTVEVDPDPCLTQMLDLASANAKKNHDYYIANIRHEFQENYIKKCLDVYEDFQMTYIDTEGQITLYYYDQAGNLTRTIPPAGVVKVTDPADLAQVKADRKNNTHTYFTEHTYPTTYKYNSLNQLVAQDVPDHKVMDIFKPEPAMNGIDPTHNVSKTAFSDKQNGQAFAVDQNGVGHIYRTTDGGENWSVATNFGVNNLNDAQFISINVGYVIGDGGIVLRTNDGGNIWNVVTPPSTNQLFRLFFTDNDNGVVYEKGGNRWTTSNGGATWQAVESSLAVLLAGNTLNDIAFQNASIAIALSSNGAMYKTIDLGQTWTLVPIRNAGLNKVISVNGTRIAVGDYGTLLKSNDLGVSWNDVSTNIVNNIVDVYFSSTSTGFAIVDSTENNASITRKLYQTINGGSSWSIPAALAGVTDVADFYFTNGTDGFAVTSTGAVYHYNGTNWSVSVSLPGSVTGVRSIAMANSSAGSSGYIGGDNGLLYKTSDHGATWVIQALEINATASSENISDLYFTANTGMVVQLRSSVQYVRHHTNGIAVGAVYYSSPTELAASSTVVNLTQNFEASNYYTVSEAFAADSIFGIYTSSPPEIVKLSIDANQMLNNNVAVYTPSAALTNKLNSIHMEGDGIHGTLVGSNGEIWTTANRGATWTERTYMTKVGAGLNSIAWLSPGASTSAIVVGDNGKLLGNTVVAGNAYMEVLRKKTTANLLAAKFNDQTDCNAIACFFTGTNGYMGYITNSYADGYYKIATGITNNLNSLFVNCNPSKQQMTLSVVGDNGFHARVTPDFPLPSLIQGAQPAIVQTSSLAFPDKLNRIVLNSDNTTEEKLLAVGNAAKMIGYTAPIATPEAGTWSLLNQFEAPQINDAHMYSTTDGVAVGNDGSILVTTDGGQTWRTVSNNVNNHLEDLNALYVYPGGTSFVNSQLIAVGNAGTVLKKASGASTWSITTPVGSTYNLNDIDIQANLGLIVGDAGKAYVSTDAGQTWNNAALITVTTEKLNAVDIIDNSAAYAVGENGTIRHITNDGVTWTAQTDPANGNSDWVTSERGTTQHLNDVKFIDYTTGYTLGDNGTFLKTNDGGLNWTMNQLEDPVSTDDYKAIAVVDNNNFYGAGTNGNVTYLLDLNDEFASLFWYDKLGRLTVSQNSKQFYKTLTHRTYSYTLYDYKGRITEVGEIEASTPIEAQYIGSVLDDANYAAWIANNNKTEVTQTYYDFQQFGSIPMTQNNLRNRVASVTFEDVNDNDPTTFQNATHYSYDIHGNVKILLQDNPNLAGISQQYKRVDYEYDLISGIVNLVRYQDGEPDAFYHFYEYDADNRITAVYTSNYPQANSLININTVINSPMWENDSKYFYYAHGPLARTEIGDEKVQAMDYAYTMQGWIKGVNSNNLKAENDIGQDGQESATNLNRNVGRDAFGYSLNYYNGDYQAIDPNKNTTQNNFVASVTAAAYLQTDAPNLFNGNINSMVTSIVDPSTNNPLPQLTAYKYDQLNRIKQMKAYRDINLASNTWGDGSSYNGSYEEHYNYNANGSILSLSRNGLASIAGGSMDNLTYTYETVANGYIRNTNKLRQIQDAVGSSTYNDDMDSQATNNYDYDETGNLVKDDFECIQNIEWTVYGKVKKLTRTPNCTTEGTAMPDLEFNYDANGNLTEKIVKPAITLADATTWIHTYYVLDASGNIMASYEQSSDNPTHTASFKLIGRELYGNKHMGTATNEMELIGALPPSTTFSRTLGNKQFFLTDHRGNNNVTILDRKKPVESVITAGTIAYFEPVATRAVDFFPGGREMNGRIWNKDESEFGYNGKQNIKEWSARLGGAINYGFRIYVPSCNCFVSVDPMTKGFPELTPYQYASNTPIQAIDLDGLEKFVHTFETNEDRSKLQLVEHKELQQQGPLGAGHLYRYHLPSGDYMSYYYDKVYTGNILRETYVGPDNPLKNGRSDYGQAPQDFVDYAAYKHDKAYDKFNAKGKSDAEHNLDVLQADKNLVMDAKVGIMIYDKGAIDPITGQKGTVDLKVTGTAVVAYFEPIVDAKQKVDNYISQIVNTTKKDVQTILQEYNTANKTEFTTTKTRKDYIKTKEK